jgi:hypothetical protein
VNPGWKPVRASNAINGNSEVGAFVLVLLLVLEKADVSPSEL